jgi:phage tail-like protein
VEIEGVTQGSFLSVDFVESFSDVIEFSHGNDATGRCRPGRTHYSNIVMRRAYANNDELHDWRRKVEAGEVERKAGSIIVLDSTRKNGGEVCRFNFFEAWPCRWRLGSWNANGKDILIEEIEIVVERIEKG